MASKNKQISIVTIFAALIFCALIVAGTLSPFPNTGKNTNQFNSVGMWLSIVMIFVSYIIPLLIYLTQIRWMIYVLAVICGIGLLSHFSVLVSAASIGYIKNMTGSMTVVLITSLIGIIAHVYWFKAALRKQSGY